MSSARHTYRGLCSRLRIIACLAPATSKELQSFYETASPICKNQVLDLLILSNDDGIEVGDAANGFPVLNQPSASQASGSSSHDLHFAARNFYLDCPFPFSGRIYLQRRVQFSETLHVGLSRSRAASKQSTGLPASPSQSLSRKSGPQASRPRTTTLGLL